MKMSPELLNRRCKFAFNGNSIGQIIEIDLTKEVNCQSVMKEV